MNGSTFVVNQIEVVSGANQAAGRINDLNQCLQNQSRFGERLTHVESGVVGRFSSSSSRFDAAGDDQRQHHRAFSPPEKLYVSSVTLSPRRSRRDSRAACSSSWRAPDAPYVGLQIWDSSARRNSNFGAGEVAELNAFWRGRFHRATAFQFPPAASITSISRAALKNLSRPIREPGTVQL